MKMLAVLVALLLLLGGPLEAAPQMPQQRLEAANAAYRGGEWGRAAELYRALAAEGIDDATVSYNLGNAYARLGDLGRARAAYERARALAPRDADVAHNLDLLKVRLSDREPAPSGYAAFAELFTMDELAGTVSLAWFAFAGTLVWYLRSRRGRAAVLAAVSLAVLLFAGSLLIQRHWGENAPPRAVVVPSAVRFYAGPGTDERAGLEVHAGTVVRVLRQDGDWRQVLAFNRAVGWVRAEELESI